MSKFFTFSEHVQNALGNEENYEAIKNLMFDLASGEDIYDGDRKITKKEANDKLRGLIRNKIFGLSDKPTKKERKRAYEKHAREFFDFIEEVVELQLNSGWRASEFFNDFVDYRSIADDDQLRFRTEDKSLINLARVNGESHDFLLQRLGEGEEYTVPVYTYGAAVGAPIDRYILGQEDWATLVNKLASAFDREQQNQVYAAVMSAYQKVPQPAMFVGNGILDANSKNNFDDIIANVGAANESDVYILGTKVALKKLSGLTDVNWRSDSQKEDVASMGRLGAYEGTTLIEIPQRFAPNDITTKLVSDKALLIMPAVSDNKFVKFVDSGEVEINEITEKGEEHGRSDDIMKYEMTKDWGVAVVLGRYFGYWQLP